MAGGAIYPTSAYPADTAGRLFPSFYSGAGGNAAPHDEGLGVKASLDADATWELRFPMPPAIPSGTFKLRLLALANATSGAAKVTVKDGRCPAGSSPSAATLTSETQVTVTWAAGNNDQYLETKVALTTVPQANDLLVVALTFNTTGWTLAAVSTWVASIIWE
jgi:hypothetical protein